MKQIGKVILMPKPISKDWIEQYFLNGVDVANRRIFLTADIDQESAGSIIKGIYLMETKNTTEPIELFVSSFGGDEYFMFGIYDAIRTVGCPLVTVAIGPCMSAAPLLVAAGSKGERYATPNAWFMVHEGHWEFDRPQRYMEMKSTTKHRDELQQKWLSLMEKHTKKDVKFWDVLCKRVEDSYFDAHKALEYGIVDKLWEEKE